MSNLLQNCLTWDSACHLCTHLRCKKILLKPASMSLPTYEQAVAKPHIIEFVAPYLEAHELSIASRVAKIWEKTCISLLWADPVKTLAKYESPFGMCNRPHVDK